MPNYYDRDGRPITLEKWSELFEDRNYQVLEQTRVSHYLVSTVWLGLDHNIMGSVPHIFETMVFDRANRSGRDLEQERYSTETHARAGHDRMVEKVRTW